MRNIKTTLTIFTLLFITSVLSAQTLKFGHVNSQEILQVMPEKDSAEAKLQSYAKELEEQMETIQVEYNNKLNTYQQKKSTWTPAILEIREKELISLQQRIQETQVALQQDLQKQQNDLIRPIIEKLNTTIQKIGKDGGFIYIFDVSNGAVTYFDTTQSIDVTELVKKELKIGVSNVATPAANTTGNSTAPKPIKK